MNSNLLWIVAIFFSFAAAELLRTRLFAKPEQTRDDGVVELISTAVLFAATQPAILFAAGWIGSQIAPEWRGALAGIPFIGGFALFLVFDDLTQYLWHRASHSYAWLYNLHRAHHNGRYMSVRLVYRNNLLYYAMMPSLWLSGLLIYLGLGPVYAVYLVIKLAVIMGAHSDVAWDRPLYRIKWLSPVMWLVERTISTPSTHHGHHGRHKDDPAVYYKGNFGNLLVLWDLLFGTLRVTRSYPASFGVENLPPATLGQQLLWPLFPENNDMALDTPGTRVNGLPQAESP